mgnify:CR=1 FL=1
MVVLKISFKSCKRTHQFSKRRLNQAWISLRLNSPMIFWMTRFQSLITLLKLLKISSSTPVPSQAAPSSRNLKTQKTQLPKMNLNFKGKIMFYLTSSHGEKQIVISVKMQKRSFFFTPQDELAATIEQRIPKIILDDVLTPRG